MVLLNRKSDFNRYQVSIYQENFVMYITTVCNSCSIRTVKTFRFNKLNANFYLITHAFILILNKQHCEHQYRKGYIAYSYTLS